MNPTLLALLLVGLMGVSCQTQQPAACSYPARHGGTFYPQEDKSFNPESPISANPDSGENFTLGSSMDHVARVMGTPNSTDMLFDETWWYYRYSRVTFRNGRVSEWDNASKNLKVKLSTSVSAKDYFTQGSPYEEVVAVMGTPTSTEKFLNEVWWYYKYSRVTFRNGRVAKWDDMSNNLKVKWNVQSEGIAAVPKATFVPSGSASSANPGYKERLPSPSRSYLYSPSLSDGYVDSHYRSGTSVRGYFRKDGTYVSPHNRSGGRVRGSSR